MISVRVKKENRNRVREPGDLRMRNSATDVLASVSLRLCKDLVAQSHFARTQDIRRGGRIQRIKCGVMFAVQKQPVPLPLQPEAEQDLAFDRDVFVSLALHSSLFAGLRMLLYVNATEYLPTTEAVGVRLTIHDKDDFPFPDTFGYSAPTGYVSSFGMKLRRMSRLPAPYGDCVIDGKTSEYIFQDYRYSTEGCYRSCFQDLVLRECNCGDPRFPVLKGREHCYVGDPVARRCLDSRLKQLGGVHSSFRCRCQQPCDQSVYSVSYSAAIWPSESLEIKLGSCEDTPAVCNDHYQEHGAMVEVFYEALNFEMFSESEAYGFVKLMADFGGQLGLWSGVSFLTCFEFLFLLIETLYMFGNHHHQLRKREKFVETQKRNML
uniref:Uncharacterized protein n=1 Tax=Plectus sambesii TaxID=2011161 RepID=A0A914XEE3_9BILA